MISFGMRGTVQELQDNLSAFSLPKLYININFGKCLVLTLICVNAVKKFVSCHNKKNRNISTSKFPVMPD